MTIADIPKYCLTLPEKPHRTEAARQHFIEFGLGPVTFFPAINGERFGLKTIHPYSVDDPSGKFFCGHHEVGIFLSHLSLWTHIMLSHDYAIIMEDDVKFRTGWESDVNYALECVPADVDWLFLGSCAAAIYHGPQIKGNVYDVKWPSCTHCYMVSRRGCEILIKNMRKAFGPVDLMCFNKDPKGGHDNPPFHSMNVYTILPRVADQSGTELTD